MQALLKLFQKMAQNFGFTVNQLLEEKRTTQENIEAIRNWIPTTRDIPEIADELIALFLMACDNSVEFCKTTILHYYDVRFNCPELFRNRTVEYEDVKSQITAL